MIRSAGSVVLTALLMAGASRAGFQESFESARVELRSELVRALEDYAQWCQEKRLFQERARVLERVLELQAEHLEARKFLGFTREKGGGWKAPAKPKTFRDYDERAAGEAPERYQAALSGYLAATVALLEQEGRTAEERELAGREALGLDPEHARLHELLGEVRSDQGWVLPETLRGKEGRGRLRAAVKRALETPPAAMPTELLPAERAIPLTLEAVAAPGLRVVGTVSAEERTLAAQAVQGVVALAREVFTSRYALPEPCTVYLFSDPTHRQAFLGHYPHIPEGERAAWEKLEGGGIQGTNDFVHWGADTSHRIDAIVRLVLGFWLSGAFEVGAQQGWAYEGFGLYLTRSLVRTRSTFLAQPSLVLAHEEDLRLRQRLLDPETNWMDETLRLFQEQRWPNTGELFSKPASALSTEEVLAAYALATYLLEVRGDALPKLFLSMGTGYAGSQGFQTAVERSLSSFERHFERWLRERT